MILTYTTPSPTTEPVALATNLIVGNRLFLTDLGDEITSSAKFRHVHQRIQQHLQVHHLFDLYCNFYPLESYQIRGLLKLLAYLKKQKGEGKSISATWVYSAYDHSSRELGQDLAELYHLDWLFKIEF